MVFEDKQTEELAKEYTDKLIEYEELLILSKEILKKVQPLSTLLGKIEEELIKRGVEIKNV